jgi:hypothetical protein
MPTAPRDVAQIRLDNALRLFDEFVHATVKHPDAAALRGLERRFAERLQIQPSYWSQIKSRSRQIGERLARQFEQCCHKSAFWMDQDHGPGSATPAPAAAARGGFAMAEPPEQPFSAPQDDDERFIVGLVLTYYRRHPQRARTRLLDLLGEVLAPAQAPATAAPPSPARPAAAAPQADAWRQVAAGVAPLKPKKK